MPVFLSFVCFQLPSGDTEAISKQLEILIQEIKKEEGTRRCYTEVKSGTKLYLYLEFDSPEVRSHIEDLLKNNPPKEFVVATEMSSGKPLFGKYDAA